MSPTPEPKSRQRSVRLTGGIVRAATTAAGYTAPSAWRYAAQMWSKLHDSVVL